MTTGGLNSSLSNLPWHASDASKDKRRSLAQHSLLKLNTTVRDDYPDHFDELAVGTRGAQLTELIIRLWPGPQPEPATTVRAATALGDGNGVAATTSAVPQRPTEVRPVASDRPVNVRPAAPQRRAVVPPADAKSREKLYWDFWEQFRSRVAIEHSEWEGQAGPSRTASNSCLPAGTTGTIFCSVFKRDGLRLELAFVRPDPAVNLARFEALHAKNQFEEALGERAEWDEMPGKKDARVYVTSPFDGIDDRDQWPAMMDWLTDQHVRFKRAIQAVGRMDV